MAHIPGLNYAQPKTKSKASRADGRQCQVVEADHSRCLVTFTLKGASQRAVLPVDRLYSEHGPCGHEQPPTVGEKIFCDMTPVENKGVNAQWLVAFAWRGRLDSAPRNGPLSAVSGMLAEVGDDSGVLLFVTAGGCRERCAFGRAAVQPGGSPLPVSEPLSRHLEVGETMQFDCRPTTTATNCRWLADRVWWPATSEDSFFDEEDEALPAGERGEFVLRATLKSILGRVELVRDYKAVLTFEHGGQRHRALLLTGKYTFPEKATAAERRDLTKVLSRGDQVVFTCHEYDKPDGTDRCGWWVMEAVRQETERAVGREAGYFQSGHLYEKIGTVKDVFAAEGLLHFVLENRREVAWFSSGEVFINGRPCDDRLSDALDVGQRVHFNAEPSQAPRGADWRCTCVWRGEMPTVEASKKRSEVAAVKKQKKSKPGKSRIDDLDDFELPAAAANAGGDSWATAPHVPPVSPYSAARGHGLHGDGDRGGRLKPARLRTATADVLDDFDSGNGGNDSYSGSGGVDWTLGNGWEAPVEPSVPAAGDQPGRHAQAESGSSAPSRPLSDASLDHALGPPGPIQSPSRSAGQLQSPGRGSPARLTAADPSRPPLLPLLEHSVPMPDPSLPRPPLLPTPEQVPWLAGFGRVSSPAATTAPTRAPPGLASPRRTASPAPGPPGLSPAALAAAAAANYNSQQQQQQQQQAAVGSGSLLGESPAQQRTGLLPTPPASLHVPLMMAYPMGAQPHWQHAVPHVFLTSQQMAQQAAAAREHQMAALLYGQGLGTQLGQQPARQSPSPMPPLTVDQESLDQMVKGGRPPVSVSVSEAARGGGQRTVPAADWEAAAAAFQAAGSSGSQASSSPTLESVELRTTPTSTQGLSAPAPAPAPAPARAPTSHPSPTLDALAQRLTEAGLDDGLEAAGENGLDEMLDELGVEGALREDSLGPSPSPSPPAAEPVSGRGQILAFVDESRGLAEWDRDGHREQVMFDRDVCYWLGARMDTLDLSDCYSPGAEVVFECVPARPDEPYQWVATHFKQLED